MSTERPRWLWVGRSLFVLGLAAWAWLGARMLPFDFLDLCYLFSLEHGDRAPQEWVHPLYVPALRLFQAAWRFGGGAGPMLVPVEGLNLFLGGAALALMFYLIERECGDSLVSAAGALLFGFSPGFRFGCARSTPYAAASLAALASLSLMLAPAKTPKGRLFAWSGLLGGLAAALHLSALALLAPALLACRSEGRRRWRSFAAYLGAFAAALTASYVWFIRCHHIDLGSLRQLSLRELFNSIEQVPGTSIVSNPSWFSQVPDYFTTLARQGPLLLISGAALIALRLWARPKAAPDRASALAAANAAGFAAFFVINNTGNGFVFASFLLVPLALARAAARSRAWRLGLLAAACAAFFYKAAAPPLDPFLQEARFLRAELGDHGVLLVPGCPAPELYYFEHLHILAVAHAAVDSDLLRCAAPSINVGPALRARVAEVLRRGAPVLLAAGADSITVGGDMYGEFKKRQVFKPWREDLAVQRQDAARLFELFGPDPGRPILSPRGSRYIVLTRGAVLPGPAAAPPRKDFDAAAIKNALKPFLGDPVVRRRAQYLEAWMAASPGDPYALADLAELARLVAPRRKSRTLPYYDEAMRAHAAGRNDEAIRLLTRVLEADPRDVEAYLSRGALYAARGDWKTALADYDRALALNPESRELKAALIASRRAAQVRINRAASGE